jgi:hypothetical protein
MELTGGADCGALGGDEKSERVEEEVAGGGSVRVERWVRPDGETPHRRERAWMLVLKMRLNMKPQNAWTWKGDDEPRSNGVILSLPDGRSSDVPRIVKPEGAKKLEMRGSSDFKIGRARGLMSHARRKH